MKKLMDILYKFPCGCYLQSLGMLGVALNIECDLHKFNKEERDKLRVPTKKRRSRKK